MSRVSLLATLVLASALMAAPGPAEELILGLDSRIEWDDNVFRREENTESDFVARAGPVFRLRSERGDVQYDLRYSPMYEGYFDLDGISGWDHFVRLQASWYATDSTEFFLRDIFSRTRNLSRILEATDPGTAPPGELTPEPELGRERIQRNVGALGVRHAFTPRWRGELQLASRMLEFSRETEFDSLSWQGEGSLHYELSKRDQVGFGLGYIQQEFEDAENPTAGTRRKGDTTRYYQAFGSWSHAFHPTWTLNLRAGPSYAESRETGEDDVTVFGAAEMVKRWETLTATLRYQRTAGSVPGLGQATDVDSALARVFWRPSPHWSYALTGSWVRDRSSIDQDLCLVGNTVFAGSCPPPLIPFGAQNVGSQDFDLELWRVEGRVERRLSRRLRVFGTAVYFNQDRDRGAFADDIGYDDFRVIFGFRYELDAVHL
jgi:hypothetical protein